MIVGRIKRKPKTLYYVDAEGAIHETSTKRKAKAPAKRAPPRRGWHTYHADSPSDARSLASRLMSDHPRTFVEARGEHVYTKLGRRTVLDTAERIGVIVRTAYTAAKG